MIRDIKVLLLASILGLALPTQSVSEPLIEGVAKTRFPKTVSDGADEAQVHVRAALKVSTLFGEPVVACAAKWELSSVTIDGTVYTKGEDGTADAWSKDISADVWNQAYIYGTDGLFELGFHGQGRSKEGAKPKGYDLDASKMYLPCDLGVMGPPDGKSVSYNVAGSPDWNEFLVRYSGKFINQTHANTDASALQEYYISGNDAKAFIKHFVNPDYTRKVGDRFDDPSELTRVGEYLDLVDARINLYPIRNYIENERSTVDTVIAKASEWVDSFSEDSETENDKGNKTEQSAGSQNVDTAAQRESDRESLMAKRGKKAPDTMGGDVDSGTSNMLKAATNVGQLVLRSNVADDEVYINGERMGSTSKEPRLLEPGTYRIRIAKAGLSDWERKVTIEPGETARIHAELTEPFSRCATTVVFIWYEKKNGVYDIDRGNYVGQRAMFSHGKIWDEFTLEGIDKGVEKLYGRLERTYPQHALEDIPPDLESLSSVLEVDINCQCDKSVYGDERYFEQYVTGADPLGERVAEAGNTDRYELDFRKGFMECHSSRKAAHESAQSAFDFHLQDVGKKAWRLETLSDWTLE